MERLSAAGQAIGAELRRRTTLAPPAAAGGRTRGTLCLVYCRRFTAIAEEIEALGVSVDAEAISIGRSSEEYEGRRALARRLMAVWCNAAFAPSR
jgi:hypothetical protein